MVERMGSLATDSLRPQHRKAGGINSESDIEEEGTIHREADGSIRSLKRTIGDVPHRLRDLNFKTDAMAPPPPHTDDSPSASSPNGTCVGSPKKSADKTSGDGPPSPRRCTSRNPPRTKPDAPAGGKSAKRTSGDGPHRLRCARCELQTLHTTPHPTQRRRPQQNLRNRTHPRERRRKYR